MLESNLEISEQQVSLSLFGYLRHYRFQLQEYLLKGVEEFDSSPIAMTSQTKMRIQEEIARIDLVLSSHINYKKNMEVNGKE